MSRNNNLRIHTYSMDSMDSISSELDDLENSGSYEEFNPESATQNEYIDKVIELAIIARQATIQWQSSQSAHLEGVYRLTASKLRELEDAATFHKNRYISAYEDLDKRFFEECYQTAHAMAKANKIMDDHYFADNFEEALCQYFEEKYGYKGDLIESTTPISVASLTYRVESFFPKVDDNKNTHEEDLTNTTTTKLSS